MRIAKAFVLLAAAASLRAEQVVVTVLATTDMHGRLYPIDYGDDKPVDRGLAKMATLIRGARAENPNTVLVDCGDAIQGTPLEYVYETFVRTGRAPLGFALAAALTHDPMMLAMNRIGYDAMTVGNHEYNFGLKVIERAGADARFPWLSANTAVAPGG
jgi:2',3'-cyclic-nucleotide 2'-phosphodiesterase/3'-nucleotidase